MRRRPADAAALVTAALTAAVLAAGVAVAATDQVRDRGPQPAGVQRQAVGATSQRSALRLPPGAHRRAGDTAAGGATAAGRGTAWADAVTSGGATRATTRPPGRVLTPPPAGRPPHAGLPHATTRVTRIEPDALVDAHRALTPRAVAELRRRLPGAAVAVLDAGQIRLAGRRIAVAGVDPASFAPFLPAVTADSRPLWQRVQAGDAALAFGTGERVHAPLGGVVAATTAAGGVRPLRVGALAAFGLPGIDAVVSRPAGEGLGLTPRRLLVVGTAEHDPGAVARAVRAVLGAGPTVDALHTTPPPVAGVRRLAWTGTWRELYQRAAPTCPGLPWQVLAAIGTIESGNGRDTSVSSAGAMGPMQFLPSTWATYGVDADRDGRASITDPVDAVFSAARYLCDNGAGRGGAALAGAVYAYNHADWYVRDVLALAARIQ